MGRSCSSACANNRSATEMFTAGNYPLVLSDSFQGTSPRFPEKIDLAGIRSPSEWKLEIELERSSFRFPWISSRSCIVEIFGRNCACSSYVTFLKYLKLVCDVTVNYITYIVQNILQVYLQLVLVRFELVSRCSNWQVIKIFYLKNTEHVYVLGLNKLSRVSNYTFSDSAWFWTWST